MSSASEQVKLNIKLVDQQSSYDQGDCIKGVLNIETKIELKKHLIVIKLKCFAQAQWSIQPSINPRLHNVDNYFTDKEKFLNCIYQFPDEKEKQIGIGFNEIPFTFILIEKKLPSSFKDENGNICYYINSKIYNENNNKWLAKSNIINVPVQFGIRRSDFLLPIGSNAEKILRFMCIKTGIIQMYVYLPKKAFTKEEIIPIEIRIRNRTGKIVQPRVTLYQTKKFICKNKQHFVEDHFEVIDGSVVPKKNTSKEIINFKISSDCSLTIKTSIIVVKHYLHITLDIPQEFDIHAVLPITITTINSINECKKNILPNN